MSSIKTKLKILFIFVAILVILALQFFWFSNSARSSVETTYQAISNSVYQIVYREYRRFDVLLDALGRQRSAGTGSERTLETFLESEIAAYGVRRGDPPLITFVGYMDESPAAKAHILMESGSAWTLEDARIHANNPKELAGQLEAGRFVIYSSPESKLGDVLMLRIRGSSGSMYRLLIGLNTEGFFSDFVKPAVASSFAEYSIEWSLSDPPPPWSEPGRPDNPPPPSEYRFNPLRGLLKRGRNDDPSIFQIYVPRVPILLSERNRISPPPSWNPPPQIETYRPMPVPGENASASFRTARIRLQNLPLEEAIELQHSLSWLGGTALLVGIGVSFCFLVLQQERLAKMRATEREFVAAITHELRTPLTVIRSAAENIRTGIVPEEKLRQYGEMIIEQSSRLGRMIDEALLVVNMETSPQKNYTGGTVDVRELVESLQSSMTPLAEQAGIRIVWITESLPLMFMCERKSLELILDNLIANAINHAYTDREKGQIRVFGAISTAGDLSFVVEDDGRGISPRETKKVFDPFYRDQFSRNSQEKGSGLGLSLVKRKVLTLGGSVRLESPYRRADGSVRSGCRFVVTLPRATEAEHEKK